MTKLSSRFAFAALVALSLGLTSCAGGSSSSSKATTTTTLYVAPPQVTTPTMIINGVSVKVPVDAAGKPILPARDNGSQIILTKKGILPQDLEACVSVPMTWTNLTAKPVRIWVDQVPPPFKQQVIAAGESFTYTPPTGIQASFLYHTTLGFDGAVEIGQVPGAC